MLKTYFQIFLLLTKSASILKLYLEHLHGCGDNNLAHACTAACHHLSEHGQTLTVNNNRNIAYHSWGDFCRDFSKLIYFPVNVAYPSLASLCLKKSFAANLIAFSGVTRVKLTAAPDDKKWTKLEQKSQSDLNTHCHQLMTIITLEYIISSQ